MADDSKNSRTYHVLSSKGDDPVYPDSWAYLTEIEASSSEQAIRLTASEKGAGTYVAVPARSWAPITVRVETPAPRIILDNGDQPEPIPGQTTLA